jgi:hypothetical protein
VGPLVQPAQDYAGLRDAYRYAGNETPSAMLIALSDWALRLTAKLTPMSRCRPCCARAWRHERSAGRRGQMTGERKYLALARASRTRRPAAAGTGRGQADRPARQHADPEGDRLRAHRRTDGRGHGRGRALLLADGGDKRTVAIGGNSVKEHFHDDKTSAR